MTKKAQMNMSLIPLALILAIILGAGYFLIQGEIKLPNFGKKIELRRLEGFPTIVYTDDDVQKQRLLITNEEEKNQFLNLVDKTGLVVLKGNIDFNKEVLLGVSSESELPVGHEIKIKKLFEDKGSNRITIVIEETFPGESCQLEEDKHVAVDLVAMPKTESEIVFDRVKKVQECN